MEEILQTVHYFFREGLWHTAFKVCEDVKTGSMCRSCAVEWSRS